METGLKAVIVVWILASGERDIPNFHPDGSIVIKNNFALLLHLQAAFQVCQRNQLQYSDGTNC
jgi:hypothetical protein